jgi:hypothetical protein
MIFPASLTIKHSITLDGEKIPCLLYADDLVLFSDTKNGLQQKLNILNENIKQFFSFA